MKSFHEYWSRLVAANRPLSDLDCRVTLPCRELKRLLYNAYATGHNDTLHTPRGLFEQVFGAKVINYFFGASNERT